MAGGEGRISKVDFAQFWERQWKKNFDLQGWEICYLD